MESMTINGATPDQKEIVAQLIATTTYEEHDPFRTYQKRDDDFASFLAGPLGLPGCGCGKPENTLLSFLNALEYCALTDQKKRSTYLKRKFGVAHVSDNSLVQLLFYVLDEKHFIEHDFSLNGSTLSDAGKVLRVLLKRHLGMNAPTNAQIVEWKFDIDLDSILAS